MNRFPIDESALTRLGHTNSYSGTFNAITEFRILHNDVPGWEADPIVGVLDIDNIQARDNNLGVVELDAPNTVGIYPNPASHVIQVKGITDDYNYAIYDITGRMVMKGSNYAQNAIDIQNLSKGTYFLNVESFDTMKFVKY